ncbi:benzoylformate decarboxylase [Acinetobacter calcoaceticus]|uniref:Benzoylformate decarboxylase n=1 Tax=Acinetobacter calcoaceticus TaxID=471 RepID=A0A4R1XT35_ACICA|nr:benzoylformate decarboxylase [Acinetobacter calcoaceticus]
MKTVHQYSYDILRKNNIKTIFGNPGSNELPFLKNFPDDFQYILALHEGAAVSMADGYAAASGTVAFVNLHSAAGTGNAMGALSNACTSHTAMVITSGQQTRLMLGVEALLTNVNAVQLPQPLVKWSHEPACAAEVPHAMSRAIHIAKSEPAGPVYLSVPYNDWDVEVSTENDHLLQRAVDSGNCLSIEHLSVILGHIHAANNIALVLGPDVERLHAVHDAVYLAEKLNVPVWGAPSPSRCPFPNRHPYFQGFLPASIAGISQILADFDLILVFGAPVFRYHQYEPGCYIAEKCKLISLSCDIQEAARAPMGLSYVCDIKDALRRINNALSLRLNKVNTLKPLQAAEASVDGYIKPERLFDLIDALAPENVIYTNEATATNSIFWQRIGLKGQGSYYFAAAGGLGYAMPAAVGIQLAKPKCRVVAIIGDGSANYNITALWTAAQYKLAVVFIILKNGSYAALKWFAEVLKASHVPGMDIPGIDFVQLARGYGVQGIRANNDEDFINAYKHALSSHTPTLIEVTTVPPHIPNPKP